MEKVGILGNDPNRFINGCETRLSDVHTINLHRPFANVVEA